MADEKLPLAREQVEVSKRQVQTGEVVVHKEVHHDRTPVTVELEGQRVEVKRIPADRFVDGPVPDRTEGETLIISVVQEVPVVVKRLKVVEEIHLIRHKTVREHKDEVEVRREDVRVERR